MSEQLSLPGFNSALQPKPRVFFSLFFAIFPDLDDAALITECGERLRREHDLTGEMLKVQRLHVTLHDLNPHMVVLQDIVDAVEQAVVAMATPSFDIVFDRVLSFPASKAFVLRSTENNTELAVFRENLGVVMKSAGFRPKRNFKPHMTLLYDKRLVAEHAIEPIYWTAKEFALVKSHVGLGRHEFLGRWPLRA